MAVRSTDSPLVRRAVEELERQGLLLLSDAKLPSLVTLGAGKKVKGSWWAHPRGKTIYAAAVALEEHPDVAIVKLIAHKVTFVYRRFFAALLAVGQAREPWQLKGLAAGDHRLLREVDKKGRVRATGDAARRLELALLAYVEQVHTETGAHAKELTSWAEFARQKGVKSRALDPEVARADLERAAEQLAAGGRATLPW